MAHPQLDASGAATGDLPAIATSKSAVRGAHNPEHPFARPGAQNAGGGWHVRAAGFPCDADRHSAPITATLSGTVPDRPSCTGLNEGDEDVLGKVLALE
jgi:hypothetical protein